MTLAVLRDVACTAWLEFRKTRQHFRMRRYSFRRSGDSHGACAECSGNSSVDLKVGNLDAASIEKSKTFGKDLFDLIQFAKVQDNTGATRKFTNDLERISMDFLSRWIFIVRALAELATTTFLTACSAK